MKPTRCFSWAGLAGLLLLAGGVGGGNTWAQATADFAGVWNNVYLSAPGRLTLRLATNAHNGNVYVSLQNIDERNQFETRAMAVTVDANGNFSGPVSGSVALAGPGLVRAVANGESPNYFSFNAAQDVMFAVKRDPGSSMQDMELLLKAPATLTVGELAGTWKMMSLGIPRALSFQWSTNYSDPNHVISGVVAVEGRQEFDAGSGTLVASPDGSFTLVFGTDVMAGTVAPGPNGALAITIPMPPPNPAMNLTFYVNASKDVMAAVHTEGNYQEMLVAVKLPASTAVGELKGLWRAGTFETPAALTLNYNGLGFVSDIPEKGRFDINTETVHAGHAGVFTAPSDLGLGTFSVLAPGLVQVSGTNASGETWGEQLSCNAGGNFMIVSGTGGYNKLLFVARAPAEEYRYGAGVITEGDYGLIVFKPAGAPPGTVMLYWASSPNRELMQTSDFQSWSAVPSTLGSHQHALGAAAAGRAFYRVRQVAP